MIAQVDPLADGGEKRLVATAVLSLLIFICSILGFLYPLVFILRFGLVPPVVFEKFGLTLLSCAFFHSTWIHLGGNLLLICILASKIERAEGGSLVFSLFVGGSIGASLLHSLVLPQAQFVAVGASGSVAAFLLFGLVRFPTKTVANIVSIRILWWHLFVLALVVQTISLLMFFQGKIMLSLPGHSGGALTGLLIALVLRRKRSPQLVT
jgi:membrane associated rhomboid family serine protease